jgi:peptidoglycan/xylan/chitin deacetylase (PgdA/CDA1 family)
MSKQWSAHRLTTHSSTVTVLLVALIFFGGGVYQRYQHWIMRQFEAQVHASAGAKTIGTRMSRTERLRKQHHIIVANTKADTDPLPPTSAIAPVLSHITTTKPIIFITIDDGVFHQQDVAEYITDHELPFTSFLTIDAIRHNYDYFGRMHKKGMTIQNHTVTHPHMPKLPFEAQKREICETSDTLQKIYERRPTLLRPPYGEYNTDTQHAAAECGIKAIVMWNVVMDKGRMEFQEPNRPLKPGDIVLLHFRPELRQDLEVLNSAANQAGLQIGRLEDYVR